MFLIFDKNTIILNKNPFKKSDKISIFTA